MYNVGGTCFTFCRAVIWGDIIFTVSVLKGGYIADRAKAVAYLRINIFNVCVEGY